MEVTTMGIRDTAARILLGNKVKQMEHITDQLVELYQRRPYMRSPEQLKEELSELDPRMIDLLLRQIDNRASFLDFTSDVIRQEIVRESRESYVWDPISQNVVDLWTDFGFGINIEVIPKDEDAQEPWQEFWTAERNAAVLGTRSISILSQEVLTAGELFFPLFISRTDGATTIRYIVTEEITDIITLPDDANTPVYYLREYASDNGEMHKIAYPDWRVSADDLGKIELPDGATRADKVRSLDLGNGVAAGTDVKMIHVAHRVKSGSPRGFPLMTAGVAWSRAYRNFLQDRASVARAVATYVDTLSTKGGTRAIDQIVASLQSGLVNSPYQGYDTNPPPAAGSTWIQNEQLKRDRMPLTTGAGDAEKDGAALLGQAGISGRVYLHWLGRGESFRLATATAMEAPTLRAFNRYQLFWSSVWSDMAKVVLTAQEKYNNANYETKEVEVNLDPIIQLDLADVGVIGTMFTDMVDRGIVDLDASKEIGAQLLRISLGKIGVSDTAEVVDVDKEE
jgi:hypothetical protein